MSLVKAILAALIKGNPQDVLFKAIPESVSNANDKAASSEYRDAMDEMVAAMYRAWEGREDHERPTAEDVFQGYHRFKRAYETAGNHKKRKILFNAFWNRFKPEFYAEGLSNILWDKVEELEYPDFIYLKKLVDSQNPKTRMFINEVIQSPEYEFMSRLEEQRLAYVSPASTSFGNSVIPTGVAALLVDFALEEFWNQEDPPPSIT